MRVLLPAYGSRRGVEPLAGVAVRVAADLRQFAAWSVTGNWGIRYMYARCRPANLPSPPSPRPGRPFPPEVTDSRVLWGLDAQSVMT